MDKFFVFSWLRKEILFKGDNNLGLIVLSVYPLPLYNNSAADDFEQILSKNRKSL